MESLFATFSSALNDPDFIPPLENETFFPSDLSQEQLLYYCAKKEEFRQFPAESELSTENSPISQGLSTKNNPFVDNNLTKYAHMVDNYLTLYPSEVNYLKLYMLELANLLEDPSKTKSLKKIFLCYDYWTGHDASDNSREAKDYLFRLCQSFLIAHPDMDQLLVKLLLERDLYRHLDLIGEIRMHRYHHADQLVEDYAKGLKETDLRDSVGKKPYIPATLAAMPHVFTALHDAFISENSKNQGHRSIYQEDDFFDFIQGYQERHTAFDLLPVYANKMGYRRRISLSESCHLDLKIQYGLHRQETWVRTEWTLPDGCREFLALIHKYTESVMREYYHAPKKKRSHASFLKKKFTRSGDQPATIRSMKAYLQDPRFEQTIYQGVEAYLQQLLKNDPTSHPDYLARQKQAKEKEKKAPRLSKKEREKQHLYAMDHENSSQTAAIDKSRLSQAKADASQVLSLLSDGEIHY